MNPNRALSVLAARHPARRAFITGAASGLGRALALRLGAAEWRLGLNDLDATSLARVALETGGTPALYPFEVADAPAFQAAAASFLATHGPPDLLFNNAGIGCGGLFLDTPLTHWREVLDVNLLGTVHGIRAFLPAMIAQGSGHVVNVASAAAFHGLPKFSAYSASKAAVAALSEALRAELAGTGVDVTLKMTTFYRGGAIGAHTRGSDAIRRQAQALVDRAPLDAGEAADRLLAHMARRRFHAVYPAQARLLWAIKRHTPHLYLHLVPPVFAWLERRLGPG
jgi:NADP-dependent 3-hydroxy acid dehydrogenase YdfG